ncbi:MAG: glycoside hydrolase family 3 protein, partial [Actinomycetota bacterium]|nr:glycoside hydrolase family 3 protein [Actinomycetota bacterium]
MIAPFEAHEELAMQPRVRVVLSASLATVLAATLAGTASGAAGQTATGPPSAGVPLVRPTLVEPVRADRRLPYRDARLSPRARTTDLIDRMTLREKVGQMTQTERYQVYDDESLITTWKLGSILSGGGSTPESNTPQAWADMVDRFQRAALQTRLGIPLLYGVDSVHGHGNLHGATVFPHNIGLGASRRPALVARAAHATAEETRASGPQWTFSPCVCVARDDRWGRTYESFGESPKLATTMAVAIEGYQGTSWRDLRAPDRVLATAKHLAGDGDTVFGSAEGDYTIDQGVTVSSRERFARINLAPYVPAVQDYNVGSVMPSFSSVDWTEDGVGNPTKMHAKRELITGWLKRDTGFGGLVISDWEGIHQIPGDWPTQVERGVNAGIDMMMEPNDYQDYIDTLVDLVRAGRVRMARVDDAVERILLAKFRLGLFERPFTDRSNIDDIGSREHRKLARTLVARSQVLLRNRGEALPLARDESVYVAGSNADDIGNQAGGWTITWQGGSGDSIPGDTILEGIRRVASDADVTFSADASAPVRGADVGVVVVGETPYSEGFGDVGGPLWAYDPSDEGEPRPPKTMRMSAADRQAVDRVCAAVDTCVVSVVSGRPMLIARARRASIDALVAS